MKSPFMKRGGMVAAAVAGMALALTGCSDNGGSEADPSASGSGGGEASGDYSITFLPKNLGNAYVDTIDRRREAKAAGKQDS